MMNNAVAQIARQQMRPHMTHESEMTTFFYALK